MGRNIVDDDKLIFADQEESEHDIEDNGGGFQYKLLIVDDEKEVHVMTKLVLSDYTYDGCSLQFISAFSIEEAKKLIVDNPDAAILLLDVVMETKGAGLEIARFIREEEENELIRIILRTGQPGQAPEKDIILNYDINDYKEKTELTTQKLFTSITTALRSYKHLLELEEKRKEISQKNIRLNEEIAKRIVAEHNLTKYNRSLEKILDTKTRRLKASLLELEAKEKELKEANFLAAVGDISSATLDQLDLSQEDLKKNLDTMDRYRSEMTHLLEKYEIVQNIIYSAPGSADSLIRSTHETFEKIEQFKQEIDIEAILAKYPEIIKDCSNGIGYISRTIEDIKRFISIDDEPEKPVDINLLLASEIDKVKKTFNRQIELQTDFDALPEINLTPENMEKAFSEIIRNSFQAVSGKGIVSIATLLEDPNIVIHISDTGHGISPGDIAHIFKPYFSRRPNTSGLGLTFAQSVIKNNKGQMEVASKKGEGTTITIKLPERKPGI